MAKIALSAEFQGFSRKIRPLKNIFRTLENGHSIRHQSIPPLSAGRKVFLTEVFGNPLGSWTSAPSGHGRPRQNACFSRVSRALTEVFARDVRANDPQMSAGYPAQKLPLWADFSLLKKRLWWVVRLKFSHHHLHIGHWDIPPKRAANECNPDLIVMLMTRGREKAHKHLAHKQFLGHPGHRSSRPGTRFLPAGDPDENVYVPWVPHTQHINF